MMFFAKDSQNIEQFKAMYTDEFWRALYKYIYYIRLEEDEISGYFEHFKNCEQLGFSYFFYVMDEDEYRREMVGFTNFALESTDKDSYIDLTVLEEKSIKKCFSQIFLQEGYFMVSNNLFKKGSQEEIEYEKTIKSESEKIYESTDKPFLRLL